MRENLRMNCILWGPKSEVVRFKNKYSFTFNNNYYFITFAYENWDLQNFNHWIKLELWQNFLIYHRTWLEHFFSIMVKGRSPLNTLNITLDIFWLFTNFPTFFGKNIITQNGNFKEASWRNQWYVLKMVMISEAFCGKFIVKKKIRRFHIIESKYIYEYWLFDPLPQKMKNFVININMCI